MPKIRKKTLARIVPSIILAVPALGKIEGLEGVSELLEGLGLENSQDTYMGLFELSGAALILFRKLAAIGSVICSLILGGAVSGHINVLGFEGEMGVLFAFAMLGFCLSTYVAWELRKEIPIAGKIFR